jgi:hypothetical protein
LKTLSCFGLILKEAKVLKTGIKLGEGVAGVVRSSIR